ncbi:MULTISPECIES: hypothetical protein [unclassified Nonomuraea]|uniref:hypothetical protein n=1 Tax=unclassified Nonomuraea TaxID=2593643 RepID=UPI0033E6C9F5
MNPVHPPTADLHEHYRQLRSTRPWLDVSMCWTVVVPDDGQALPLGQLAVIDQTTGARLTSEWLEQPHPYTTVRSPTQPKEGRVSSTPRQTKVMNRL